MLVTRYNNLVYAKLHNYAQYHNTIEQKLHKNKNQKKKRQKITIYPQADNINIHTLYIYFSSINFIFLCVHSQGFLGTPLKRKI